MEFLLLGVVLIVVGSFVSAAIRLLVEGLWALRRPFLLLAVAALGVALWPVAVPALGCWLMWRAHRLNQKLASIPVQRPSNVYAFPSGEQLPRRH